MKKTSFAFFLSFLITSPAIAKCPSGYGQAKEDYNRNIISAVMLDYGVAYSPEYLSKCTNSSSSSYDIKSYHNIKCGNLKISSLGEGYVYITPADPSLDSISFENLNSEYLSKWNLPRNFQDAIVKEWCEMNEGSSSSAMCYREYKTTSIYIPHYTYNNGVRKKVFVERRSQTISECRQISF